jgi:hypothetical protein
VNHEKNTPVSGERSLLESSWTIQVLHIQTMISKVVNQQRNIWSVLTRPSPETGSIFSSAMSITTDQNAMDPKFSHSALENSQFTARYIESEVFCFPNRSRANQFYVQKVRCGLGTESFVLSAYIEDCSVLSPYMENSFLQELR